MGTRKSDKHQLLTRTYTNQTTSLLMHSLSTFRVKTSQGQTWIHTHHDSNLEETTTSPLIVYSMPFHEAHIQMTFCFGTPKWESQIPKVGTPVTLVSTLGPHNFVCRPPIEMKLKAKL
jgi:hypothetical protein